MITSHVTRHLSLSRRRLDLFRRNVPALLTALGIDFRRGDDFWSDNRFLLPEIYAELRDEIRSLIRTLHPDVGGDAEQFRKLIENWRHAQRIFQRHLPVPINPAPATITIVPPGKSIFDLRQKRLGRRRANNKRYYERHLRQSSKRVTTWKKLNPARVNAMSAKYWASPKGQAAVARRREKRRQQRLDESMQLAA